MQDAASEGYATSDDESSSESTAASAAAAGSDDDIDMEDLGGRIKSGRGVSTSLPSEVQEPAADREMLTPALRANLSKQGYKLIGAYTSQHLQNICCAC